MKPYNASNPCPKCGHGKVSTRYHRTERVDCVGSWSRNSCRHENREHIERQCARCSYLWVEAPLEKNIDPDVGMELREEVIERLKQPVDPAKLVSAEEMRSRLETEDKESHE